MLLAKDAQYLWILTGRVVHLLILKQQIGAPRVAGGAAYLVALGKHRILVHVADKVCKCCPDTKAHAKDQKVARNEGIEHKGARPASNPPAVAVHVLLSTYMKEA